jgi:hypothetical protein
MDQEFKITGCICEHMLSRYGECHAGVLQESYRDLNAFVITVRVSDVRSPSSIYQFKT